MHRFLSLAIATRDPNSINQHTLNPRATENRGNVDSSCHESFVADPDLLGKRVFTQESLLT